MPRDVFQIFHERRSVRRYLPKPIPERDLERIVQSATFAPSAGGLQSYRIVVVRDPERRRDLSRAAYDQDFLERAPVALVFFADRERARVEYGDRGAELFAVQDATIAASYAQLAAEALGLGSVWVGAFDEASVRAVVGAEPSLPAVAMLAIGHAAEAPVPVPRRALDVIVSNEVLGAPPTPSAPPRDEPER